MNFLGFDHNSLLAFHDLKILLFDILIHLGYSGLMDEQHIIYQICHFKLILLLLQQRITLLIFQIDLHCENRTILGPSHHVFIIMTYH